MASRAPLRRAGSGRRVGGRVGSRRARVRLILARWYPQNGLFGRSASAGLGNERGFRGVNPIAVQRLHRDTGLPQESLTALTSSWPAVGSRCQEKKSPPPGESSRNSYPSSAALRPSSATESVG